MGQLINVTAQAVGDVAVLGTDRSVTGQDGAAFASQAEAAAVPGFPGDLAGRIFAADAAIDHVFLASNQVLVRRRGGWSDDDLGRVSAVVTSFFSYYPVA